MINFAIIGGGWRSEFYIRAAKALPNLFNITGIYLRNEKTANLFRSKYNIPTFDSLDATLNTNPDFVVSCVTKASILDEIALLCEKGFAVLSETPAGISGDDIKNFEKKVKAEWKVQIAEQFHLMPTNNAIKSVIDRGALGEVNYVYLSCCHDYHAVSLARFFLGIGDETPDITSLTLPDRILRYNGRYGEVAPETVLTEHKLAVLKWDNKTAVYDFNKEQYFSEIRKKSIVIRGEKGEIQNGVCCCIEKGKPKSFALQAEPLFENTELSEDEQAVAVCLIKMDEYLRTGKEFYSLKKAISDVNISLKI